MWIPTAKTLTTQRENGNTCTRPQLQVSVASVWSGTHELGAAAAVEGGEGGIGTAAGPWGVWIRRRQGGVWHRRRPEGGLAPPAAVGLKRELMS